MKLVPTSQCHNYHRINLSHIQREPVYKECEQLTIFAVGQE